MISKTEDRLRGLAERGWRPSVETHLLPKRAVEQHGLPGPWTHHTDRYYIGWMIYMRPGERLLGASAQRGGVFATLDPCLDWAEAYATSEAERLAQRETRA